MRYGHHGVFVLAIIAALLLGSGRTPAEDAPRFLGSASCKKCHLKQYKSWEATSMAQAFDSLKPGVAAEAKEAAGLNPNKDYTTQAACLSCHTTGYGQPGGFTSIEATPDLAGVGCESCHGAAGLYNPQKDIKKKDHPIKLYTDLGMVYPSTAADCTVCHNETSPFNAKVDPKYAFDFDERVAQEAGSHAHFPLKGDHPDLQALNPRFQ